MSSFVSQFDVGLFDLDGVCYLGPEAVPHAVESIRAAIDGGMRQAFVTNNASRSPADVAAHLESLGIPAPVESVITSSAVACQMLSEMVPAGSPVLVLGTEALRDEVRKVGLTVVESADDTPVAVIHGFTPDLNWERMSEAALAIRAGAIYFATNLDLTIPRDRGLMVGNGSMVLAIATSTGVEPYSAGKPQPEIFHIAARNLGAQHPFAIGDNLSTDIQGAVAADIPSLHVLTGLATAREVCLAIPEQRPTYLADDLRALHEPYPAQRWNGGWAVSGDVSARWNGEAFELSGTHPGFFGAGSSPDQTLIVDLDTYRALARAAWETLDTGAPREAVESAIPDFEVQR